MENEGQKSVVRSHFAYIADITHLRVSSPCYRLAKELARILSPLAGHNGYTVRNSMAFVDKLQRCRTTWSVLI